MPKVRKGESKSKYVSRAIKHMVEKEGLSQKHAAGKAYGMWKQHLSDKRKK